MGSRSKGADCDYWHPPVCRHWREGTCIDDKKCAFLHRERPVKERKEKSAAPAQADPKAGAKAGAKAKAGARMAYFQANCTGPPPSIALSNSFDPLAGAIAMPMIPRARACNFSCCLAGGDTQEIITKKVAFHKHQTRISKRHEKDPTYIKWDLKIKNLTPSKNLPEGTWFRGDGTPKGDFADLEEIEWYEEQARNEAYRLYKQAHSVKELTDEEFFVQHAGGDPQPTIASSTEMFADRSYIADTGASFHFVALNTLT